MASGGIVAMGRKEVADILCATVILSAESYLFFPKNAMESLSIAPRVVDHLNPYVSEHLPE